jgi:AraC-like DNA-binding protein
MTPREERIIEVLCDELKLIKPSALFLPTSNHDKLKQVIDALLNDIADTRTLAELADLVCVSPRTLTRLFVNELGMNFNEWRTRLKVLEAIRRLHEKQPVTEIAIDLGYESSSAFIHMFRKYVGKTPAQYLGE